MNGFVTMENGSKFTKEEIFLFSLNRFVFPCKLAEMAIIYGKDWTQWDRAFNWFVEYVVENFAHLLIDNLEYWRPQFPDFAECIRLKLFEKSNGNIIYAPDTYKICSFYDCTVIKTSRPGAGPAGGGVNAPRYNDLIQEAYYCGHKKFHGIKYLTLELPNGMCGDMYGPTSFK
jgi:hypothetical protein